MPIEIVHGTPRSTPTSYRINGPSPYSVRKEKLSIKIAQSLPTAVALWSMKLRGRAKNSSELRHGNLREGQRLEAKKLNLIWAKKTSYYSRSVYSTGMGWGREAESLWPFVKRGRGAKGNGAK